MLGSTVSRNGIDLWCMERSLDWSNRSWWDIYLPGLEEGSLRLCMNPSLFTFFPHWHLRFSFVYVCGIPCFWDCGWEESGANEFSSLNTFVGQLKSSTALLGVLHAFYGLGCAISPIVATKMVEAGLGWNSYYYVLLGWAILNTLSLGITYHPNFMRSSGELEEVEMERNQGTEISSTSANKNINANGCQGRISGNRVSVDSLAKGRSSRDVRDMTMGTTLPPGIQQKNKGPLQIVLTNRFCWLVSLYIVLYLGLEISTGGWVVEFMIQVTSQEPPPFYNFHTFTSCFYISASCSPFPLSISLLIIRRSAQEHRSQCLMSQRDSG